RLRFFQVAKLKLEARTKSFQPEAQEAFFPRAKPPKSRFLSTASGQSARSTLTRRLARVASARLCFRLELQTPAIPAARLLRKSSRRPASRVYRRGMVREVYSIASPRGPEHR